MIELDTFDPLLVVFVCDVVVVVVFCERRLYRIVLLDEDPPSNGVLVDVVVSRRHVKKWVSSLSYEREREIYPTRKMGENGANIFLDDEGLETQINVIKREEEEEEEKRRRSWWLIPKQFVKRKVTLYVRT